VDGSVSTAANVTANLRPDLSQDMCATSGASGFEPGTRAFASLPFDEAVAWDDCFPPTGCSLSSPRTRTTARGRSTGSTCASRFPEPPEKCVAQSRPPAPAHATSKTAPRDSTFPELTAWRVGAGPHTPDVTDPAVCQNRARQLSVAQTVNPDWTCAAKR